MNNKTRLQQNNIDLSAIKTIAEGLPALPTVTIDGEAISGDLALVTRCYDLAMSGLPYDFYNGSAVVLDGEIHILGSGSSSYSTNHYKWNGSEWTSVSTLPYNFYNGSAVVLNGEIHILSGSNGNYTKHYKWNGSEWTSVSTLPYDFYNGSAVVLDGEIHILGGNNNYKRHSILNAAIYRQGGK